MYKRLKYNILGGLVIQNWNIEEKITSKVHTYKNIKILKCEQTCSFKEGSTIEGLLTSWLACRILRNLCPGSWLVIEACSISEMLFSFTNSTCCFKNWKNDSTHMIKYAFYCVFWMIFYVYKDQHRYSNQH